MHPDPSPGSITSHRLLRRRAVGAVPFVPGTDGLRATFPIVVET